MNTCHTHWNDIIYLGMEDHSVCKGIRRINIRKIPGIVKTETPYVQNLKKKKKEEEEEN